MSCILIALNSISRYVHVVDAGLQTFTSLVIPSIIIMANFGFERGIFRCHAYENATLHSELRILRNLTDHATRQYQVSGCYLLQIYCNVKLIYRFHFNT